MGVFLFKTKLINLTYNLKIDTFYNSFVYEVCIFRHIAGGGF